MWGHKNQFSVDSDLTVWNYSPKASENIMEKIKHWVVSGWLYWFFCIIASLIFCADEALVEI